MTASSLFANIEVDFFGSALTRMLGSDGKCCWNLNRVTPISVNTGLLEHSRIFNQISWSEAHVSDDLND